jgi:hypothetical protein
MRSARRKILIEKRKKKSRIIGIFLKLIAPVAIVLFVLIYLRLTTSFWNGLDKVNVAYRLPNGDAAVTVLDPKLTDATTLVIPGDTEVTVARNYGILRIKNVWQLSLNEKLGGKLLPETITQNFLFPVFLWSDTDGSSLASGNVSGIIHFIFFPKSTNIAFGDRLSIGIFSMKLQNIGRDTIDLGKSQFLTKQKLNDGTPGYVLTGAPSPLLTVYFSDNVFASENLKVEIMDATGKGGVADKLGQIVEIMGAKVVAVSKLTPVASDCLVSGKDQNAVRKIANLFSCKVEKGTGDFDVVISLGQAFAKRF